MQTLHLVFDCPGPICFEVLQVFIVEYGQCNHVADSQHPRDRDSPATCYLVIGRATPYPKPDDLDREPCVKGPEDGRLRYGIPG